MSLFVSFGKATEDDEGDNHANLGVKDGAGEGGTDEKGVEWCQNYQKGKAKTNSEKDNSSNPTHFGLTSTLISTPITSPLFKSSSSSQKSQNIHDDGAPRETELPLYITALLSSSIDIGRIPETHNHAKRRLDTTNCKQSLESYFYQMTITISSFLSF